MSKPTGTYWTCKPSRYAHDPEEMVEPWKGSYTRNTIDTSGGTMSGDFGWTSVADADIYELESEAWDEYGSWLAGKYIYYEEESRRAEAECMRARKAESDAVKMKELLDDKR